MPMYECSHRGMVLSCDKIINPSELDQRHYPTGEFIPVPVPRSVKWKLREKAEVFIHNAGNGGLNGRNGTQELIDETLSLCFVREKLLCTLRGAQQFSLKLFFTRHVYSLSVLSILSTRKPLCLFCFPAQAFPSFSFKKDVHACRDVL